MSFHFCDQHIDDYYRLGYTIFRGIVPASLVEDLRRTVGEGVAIIRSRHGGQAQRFQPVGAFEIDQKPFQDYAELPEIRNALERIVGQKEFFYGHRDLMGVLIEPVDLPWCTNWHRDWRDHSLKFPIEEWNDMFQDIEFMNQVNCALYKDHCTWVVPGSHLRQNLQRELDLFPDRPVPGPELDGKSYAEREYLGAEREYLGRDYCRAMPGAQQLFLEAGDFALYRANMWHLGNYVPYSRRATLHDALLTPRSGAWRSRVIGGPGAPESAADSQASDGQPVRRRFVGIRKPGGGEEYRKYQKTE